MVGDAVKCCGCRCSVTCDRRLHSVHNARALPVHLQSVHGTLLQSSALQRLDLCAGQQRRRRRRLGRRAVRLHGRLLCRRRCNAASETCCRKKPSGESGPESTLCALCTTGTPAMALKRSALHWKHCVIGCCCETTWSVAASCRCNPCSALPLIIIVIIMITILVVIIVVIIIVIIVTIIVRALCASADKAGA